ncbi:MAG: Pyridoxal phosphate biosynthetic protein PdxA [Thermoproteota archaeon]|nr:Pyridoxal phosphate biosynthetic protein PdxA [Thermoproteota archaeon]
MGAKKDFGIFSPEDPAFDIAGRGIANAESMTEAIKVAANIAKKKFGKMI